MQLYVGHQVGKAHALVTRVDPTRTTMIRRAYERDMVRRFKALRSATKEALTPYNFGERTNAPKFSFPRSDDKVAAFSRWLNDQVNKGILEVQTGTPMSKAGQNSWQSKYIMSAYQRGIAMSAQSMRTAGIEVEDSFIEGAFFRPIHADRVGLIYTRTFNDLQGVTQTMSTQMSRVLAQGIAEGLSMEDIADNVLDRVDSIGITRARTLVRTEVIAAHAEATLNTYEEGEVLGVNVLSEFATAGDNVVCPKCEELEGREYTVQEARGIIPVHPSCRCAWLPVVMTSDKKRILR